MNSVLSTHNSNTQDSVWSSYVSPRGRPNEKQIYFFCAVAAPKGSQEPQSVWNRYSDLPKEKKSPASKTSRRRIKQKIWGEVVNKVSHGRWKYMFIALLLLIICIFFCFTLSALVLLSHRCPLVPGYFGLFYRLWITCCLGITQKKIIFSVVKWFSGWSSLSEDAPGQSLLWVIQKCQWSREHLLGGLEKY